MYVYLVYRQLGSAPGAYLEGKPLGAGHVYLAFDDQNVDKKAWGKLVEQLGGQADKNPILRKANPAAETFSFHPRAVLEEQLGIMNHPDNLASTLYTASSFIGYNDKAPDVETFLNAKNPGAYPNAPKAMIFKLNVTQQQQFDLYIKAQDVRVNINLKNKDVCGTYKLPVNNCGTWAVKKMVRAQGIDVPKGFSNLNIFGTGIGGVQDYLPLTYLVTGGAMTYGYGKLGVQATYSAGKTAVVTTGQSIYWTGNKAKELVESTGGEFFVAPLEDDQAGGVCAGIRWN